MGLKNMPARERRLQSALSVAEAEGDSTPTSMQGAVVVAVIIFVVATNPLLGACGSAGDMAVTSVLVSGPLQSTSNDCVVS